MRPIKYKQALTDFGRFCGWHYWGFIDGKFVEPSFSSNFGVQAAQKNSQEYTGLKDKNGKEIYESDIVRATANGNRKYQIVWMDGGLGHWWIADIQRDNFIPNKIPINLNAIEVIGSIWENPELLEVKQ